MSSLADMLAGDGDAPPESGDGSGDASSNKMAEASLKSFFEACQKGDWTKAAADFGAAVDHCSSADYSPDGGGDMADSSGKHGVAIVLSPHGR